MSLHTSERLPDWELIAPEDRNAYQQRAAETNGWDTPGNRETLKGIAGTTAGIIAIANDLPELGLAGLVYGRYKDLKDGRVAEATGTKSPKGEAIDATADKLLMAAALPVVARKEVISPIEASFVFAQQGIAGLSSLSVKRRGETLHPSRSGKYGMFGQWLSICLGLASNIAEKHGQEKIAADFRKAQKATMAAGLALGTVASVNYLKQALNYDEDS